jgi:hypothetical protein
MIWVTWRQHRAQALACLILFAALTAVAVGFGIPMHSAFGTDGLPACLAHSGGAGCVPALTSFVNRFARGGPGSALLSVLLLAVPGMLGAVVGATLLGRELELGTWRLAWSQSVPRTRWLVTRLGLVTGGLVVFGGAVSAVMTWYYRPLDQVGSRTAPGLNGGGTLTFTASLLCSFGVAVLIGLLLRNTIAAVVVGYIAWELPTGLTLLLNGPLYIPGPAVMRIPCHAACPALSAGSALPATGHLGDTVLSITRGGGELVVSYLPSSRYWTEQFLQAGLLLAVAVGALSTAIWLLHRRTS